MKMNCRQSSGLLDRGQACKRSGDYKTHKYDLRNSPPTIRRRLRRHQGRILWSGTSLWCPFPRQIYLGIKGRENALLWCRDVCLAFLSEWSKIILIDLRKIGLDCADVKFRVESEDELQTVHLVYSIEGAKLARAQMVDSWALSVYDAMNKYQTNM